MLEPPSDHASPAFFFGVPTPPATVEVDPVRDIDWSEVLDYSTSTLSHTLDWAQEPLLSPGAVFPLNEHAFDGTWHTGSPGMNTREKSTFGLGAVAQQPLGDLGRYLDTELGTCDITTLDSLASASSEAFMMPHTTTLASRELQAPPTMETPPTSPAVSNRHTSPSSMIVPVSLKCDEPGCKSRIFKSVNDFK